MQIFSLHRITRMIAGSMILTGWLGLAGCGKPVPHFESLSPSKTGIGFRNNLPEREGLNILYYLYYYEGGGVGAGDINNDGLPDLYFTANSKGNNKLYQNKGNLQFEDITAKAGVGGSSEWNSGVTMADVNADGWLDIYVCAVSQKSGLKGRNELYINNKNGTFTEKAREYGLGISSYACQAAFFDYDRDGDLDCYLLNQSDRPFQNIVDTSFRRRYDSLSGDRLFRNDLNLPAAKFTDVSATAGIYQSNLGYGLGLAIADMNHDGWDDVYVGNDFHENDYYYINNGNGTFSESGALYFRHYSRFSMGNDAADFNNDGQPDVVTADMLPDDEKILKTYGSDENADIYQFKITRNGYQHQYSKNCLQVNNGKGTSFSETALLSGVSATDWSWSALFADVDNDGNKDIFFTSGVIKRTTDLDYVRFISDAYVRKQMDQSASLDKEALDKMPDGISHNYLFRGDGQLLFENKSKDWGLANDKGYFTGAAYADLDNDGDLDMVVNAINDEARVYRNNGKAKNFISAELKGEGLNTAAIGAKAWLFTNGKMQYLQLSSTRGFLSCSDTRLHFGLGEATKADSILIVWPSRKFQVLKNINAGQRITAREKEANGMFVYENYFPSAIPLFAAANVSTGGWRHRENPIMDFHIQYLIPQAKSTRGPKVAVADVNADQLEDIYVCGAAGQQGALLLQQPDGSFKQTDTELFAADAAAEDTDALFFDANGDKAPDLYVVAGGNEQNSNVPTLLDRLYLNDGKGKFVKTANSLPSLYANKSCVATADADGDGDADLFTGVHANAVAYGVPQTSYLLLNDGKGNFTTAPKSFIDLENAGMVTSAAFADINQDNQPDLVVTGEWMPLLVFTKEKTGFSKKALPQSTGLWQSLFADDVDGDGFTDLIAGNWGWNNKFKSGKTGPLHLYVADFDKNGKTDQLLTYHINGKEYPFLAKDEVERQLPLLKKHYLRYAEYGGVPAKEVFYGWVDTVKPYLAENLGSAIFFGNGNGGFSRQDLPVELQLSPLFSFLPAIEINGRRSYMAGGNFYDVIPYEGRYDARALAVFTCNRDRIIQYQPDGTLSAYNGQVRDLEWISNKKREKRLLVAANNSPLQFFIYTK